MLTTKKCNACELVKPTSDFYKKWKGGRQYPRSTCKECFNGSVDRSRANERKRQYRSDEALRANHICVDAKSSDKKNGRNYDLDVEFVADLIAKPCSYCGVEGTRMTLDRLDNSKGHTKENVVPACYRCNMIKGNMPYEAWKFMVDGVKQARLANAFGEWGLRPICKRNTDT